MWVVAVPNVGQEAEADQQVRERGLGLLYGA